MPFAYKIKETADTKIVHFKLYPLGLWCVLIGFMISEFIKLDGIEGWIASPFWIFGGYIVISSWEISKECSRAMRNGGIKMSGSKWSLTNPLTIEIPKEKIANKSSEPT